MNRFISLVKAAWILAVVAALVFHLQSSAKDSFVVFYWSLVVLTFPLGLLPFFAWGLLVGEGLVASTTLSTALAVLVMTSVGFFQWFWLVPRVFRWGKSRILASRSS
ncbi:hypothetical protein MYXO_01802 [Myxococcaceae bacterium]|jgi:hypothetical protein|nr:hypothetical protein MYXO_01802 [Myxococcaceae bacterium]